MFKNMKLGTKIALGFGLLIVLACMLGGLAILNMKKAQNQSNILAYEYVPEVDLAGNVETYAQKTMLGMRSYALSESETYLAEGQKNLAEMKKSLAECQTLSEKAKHLTKLKDGLQACNQSLAQYEQLANKTVEENRALAQNRQKLDAAAQEMMKSTSAFLASQNEAFKKDLTERQQKIQLATDIVTIGMNVRTLGLKGQAQGKSEMMEQALAQLDGVNAVVTQLRPITKDTEDTQKIEQIDKAVKAQRTA
jgi:methyl-accepting chemotaxis protein